MTMKHTPESLEPAQHVKQPRAEGWRGVDLTEDELVDDEYIEQDPDSFKLGREPDGSDAG